MKNPLVSVCLLAGGRPPPLDGECYNVMRTLKKIAPGVGPKYPQVVVLVGATGVLARRKLLPGHLTFDLADASKTSLSFYDKRPGPEMSRPLLEAPPPVRQYPPGS